MNKMLLICINFLLVALLYGGETLPFDPYFEKAMRNHPEIISAKLDIDIQKLESKDAYFSYLPLPTLSINSQNSVQGARKVPLGGDIYYQEARSFTSHSAAVSMSYYLWKWGETHRMLSIRTLAEEQKRLNYISLYRKQLMALVHDLIDGQRKYYQKELGIQRLNSLAREKNILETKVERGNASAVTSWKMNAEIRLDSSRIKLLEDEYTNLYESIVTQYGIEFSARDIIQDVNSFSYNTQKPGVVSPEIREIEEKIKSAEIELKSIQWNKYPDIGVNVGYYRSGTQPLDVWSTWNENWNAGASLNISFRFIDLFSEKPKSEIKRLQIRQFQQQLNQYLKDQNQWYVQIKRDLESAKSNIMMLESNGELYNKIYDYEYKRFQQGLINFEDFNSVRREYTQNQVYLQDAYLHYLELLYEYYINIGKYDPL